MLVEELELPWASGTFVADIWEGTGLACRQTLQNTQVFLNQNLRVFFFFFWRGQEQVTIAKFVSLGDWNMQVYVRFGP